MAKKIADNKLSNQSLERPSEDVERKEYLEQRKVYIDLQHQVSESFDKWVLTLASGALGLSFTFIRQIVPLIKPETLNFLSASWACLVIAILAILFSLFTSQVGMIKACDELDGQYIDDGSQKIYKPTLKGWLDRLGDGFTGFFGWRPFTQILNIIAIMFTITGLSLLLWFGILNVPYIQLPMHK